MKPRVFLSHSKKDKEFIIKVSEYLRIARIDCWYDDWEIPPGESIRKKIFEDGLPSCDLFLIYLTENSVDSYWVRKELDSMITIESESKDRLLLPFVSKNDLREKLSSDLRSVNIPELNNENFIDPICKLIARIWEIFTKLQLNKQKEIFQSSETLLKNQVLELENRILHIQLIGNVDIELLRTQLKKITYTFNRTTLSLEEIFKEIYILLVHRSARNTLLLKLSPVFEYVAGVWGYDYFQNGLDVELPEILGKLVVMDIIYLIPSTIDYKIEEFSLTPLGIKLANKMMTEKLSFTSV